MERVIEYAESTHSDDSFSTAIAPPISSKQRSGDLKERITPTSGLLVGLKDVLGQLASLGKMRWQEKAKVRLTHFQDLPEFWVIRDNAQDLLGRVINEPLAVALSPVKDPPSPGMKYMIRSQKRGGLVRVEIEAVKKKGLVEVSHMDVGLVEIVKVDQLLIMPPLLLDVPALAWRCVCSKVKEPSQMKELNETPFIIECLGWNEDGDVMMVDIPSLDQFYDSKDSFKPVPAFATGLSDSEVDDTKEKGEDKPVEIPSQESSFSQITSSDSLSVAPLKPGKEKKLSGKKPFAIPKIPPIPVRSSPEMLNAGSLRRNYDSFVIPETVSPFDPTQCIPSDDFVVVHVVNVQAFDSILVTYLNNEIEISIQGLQAGQGCNPSDHDWKQRAVTCLETLLLDQDVQGHLMVKRTTQNSFGAACQKIEVECQLFEESVASMLNELGEGIFSLTKASNTFHIDDLPPLEDFSKIQDSVFKFSCVTNFTDAIFVKLKKREDALKKMESLIGKVELKPIEKSSLSEGLLVLAEYEYSMYRACVKHWDDNNIVQVLFIDHGNEKSYDLEDLFVLPEQFMEYAQFCHLVQLKWVERRQMTDIEMVRSLKLLHGTDGDLKLTLSHMTKDGIPVVTPRSKSNRYLMADFKNTVVQVGFSIHNRAEDLGCPSAKGVIQGVIIRQCEEDPDVFYMVPDENLELGIEISRRLASFYASHARPDLYVPSESEVLAYRDEGNNFYRVIAKSVDEDLVTCYFIDYGLEEELEPCDLFPLITNVEDYPELALECRMAETTIVKQIEKSQRYLVEVVKKDCNQVQVKVLKHVP